MESQQPLNDRELCRLDILRRLKAAVRVTVDGLEDQLSHLQVRQLLLEDVNVVAAGMQRRESQLHPLLAVVAVVVVGRHVRDLILPEDPDEPSRQRRLTGCRVADDAEQDRTGHGVDGIARMCKCSGARESSGGFRARWAL